MKRSPGPTPSSPLITTRATSDSASSRLTRSCMRSVRMSRGRCTPGRSTRISCRSASRSVATPRIARRVVCGRTEAIATWEPTIALTRVDLPALGRPASPMKPELVIAAPPGSAPASASISPSSVSWSWPQRWRTPWTAASVTSAQCSGQIATSPSSRGPAVGPVPSTGKASTSVGASLPRWSRLSSWIRSAVDQLDREVAVGDSGGGERRRDRGAQIRGNVGEVEAQERGVGPCSARAARSRLPCSS